MNNNKCLSLQDENIYHGIGKVNVWKHLTRDLIIDLQKGLAYQDKPKRKLSRNKYKVNMLKQIFYFFMYLKFTYHPKGFHRVPHIPQAMVSLKILFLPFPVTLRYYFFITTVLTGHLFPAVNQEEMQNGKRKSMCVT